MRLKILAGIVTHNRKELLRRCIEGVRSQSRPPDELVVIDNGSTDGTASMLADLGIDAISQENVGSAGGWHRAIDMAKDHECDAVWLMDDDGFPEQGALEKLERAMRNGVSCVSSVVVREDDPERFVFPFPILDGKGLPVVFGFPRRVETLGDLSERATGGLYPFAHLFNGALIAVAAVRAVGNVDRRFFIFGDEVDFFFRLRQFGPVLSVLNAKHFHPDVSRRPYTPVKVYFYVKNSLILNARYFNVICLRNILTVLAALGRTARRNGLRASASYLLGRDSAVLYRAVYRGLRGQVGMDFNE